MEVLCVSEIEAAVRAALLEDIGSCDVTTIATVPEAARSRAFMVAREPLTLAGIQFAISAFQQLSPGIQIQAGAADGQKLAKSNVILEAAGSARAILSAERVALNFVQRLSGVATLTCAFADAVSGTKARILDTRKTTPGWRRFEKYAVRMGGGTNHRFGLFDMVLIKDNHLAALATAHAKPDPVTAAIHGARQMFPGLKIEVEADSLDQVRLAVAASPDFVLLDNMSLEELREAVKICAGKVKTEASGGVNMQTVRAIAETGVDFISVGALTHSARAVDIALDFAT